MPCKLLTGGGEFAGAGSILDVCVFAGLVSLAISVSGGLESNLDVSASPCTEFGKESAGGSRLRRFLFRIYVASDVCTIYDLLPCFCTLLHALHQNSPFVLDC